MPVASPSLVPGFDTYIYMVHEVGRAYRETDEARVDRKTLIRDLIAGKYDQPVRIIAFNIAKGWSRDVSAEIARDISERASAKGEKLTGPVQAFVEYELERARRHARRAPPF